MQAIVTKYLGPTDRLGSRFKATAVGGSVTVSYNYSLGTDANHKAAAAALMAKLGWKGSMEMGWLPDGTCCHVFSESRNLVDEVLLWAKTPGNHGGNPYLHGFVQTARQIAENSKR